MSVENSFVEPRGSTDLGHRRYFVAQRPVPEKTHHRQVNGSLLALQVGAKEKALDYATQRMRGGTDEVRFLKRMGVLPIAICRRSVFN